MARNLLKGVGMSSVRCSAAYSLALVVFSLLPALAQAQAQAPQAAPAQQVAPVQPSGAAPDLELTPPDLGEPRKGSLAAEIAMATLGDIVGIGLTAGVGLATICIDDCADDGLGFEGGIMLTMAARPVFIGGMTALGGRWSGGEGKASMAMLGALPGTLMMGLSWLAMAHDSVETGGSLLVVGHLAAIGGAVAAYRYSARSVFSERMARALRYTPGPYIDQKRGVAGLSLSGSF